MYHKMTSSSSAAVAGAAVELPPPWKLERRVPAMPLSVRGEGEEVERVEEGRLRHCRRHRHEVQWRFTTTHLHAGLRFVVYLAIHNKNREQPQHGEAAGRRCFRGGTIPSLSAVSGRCDVPETAGCFVIVVIVVVWEISKFVRGVGGSRAGWLAGAGAVSPPSCP